MWELCGLRKTFLKSENDMFSILEAPLASTILAIPSPFVIFKISSFKSFNFVFTIKSAPIFNAKSKRASFISATITRVLPKLN